MEVNRGIDSTVLGPGRWSGAGVNLQIGEHSSDLDFHGAAGLIDGPFVIGDGGRFELAGQIRRRGPGPGRDDEPVRPAVFAGSVAGDAMVLTVTLSGPGEMFGEFELGRGARTRHIKLL